MSQMCSSSCHVAASEDEPGWKAGHYVAFCVLCSACSRESSEIATESIQSTSSPSSSSSNSSSAELSKNKSCNSSRNRTCLTLEKRHEIIQFAKDNPTWGYRKLAKKFGVGKTQIQSIIKKKQEILEAYENNQRKGLKRQRSGKYADVNEAVWEWYCLCRSSNIPVSGTMLQEEAFMLVIAEKLYVDGFVASNG